MRIFRKRDIVTLVAGVSAIQLLFYFLADWYMFHPVRRRYTFETPGVVNISTNDCAIAALVIGKLPNDRVLLYCHGNAEDIMDAGSKFSALREMGYTIVSADYPGYGLSGGKPSEDGCYRNVNRLYDWLVSEKGTSPENITVTGFSIGSGPAIELATKRKVGALVLEAPFLSAARSVTRIRLFAYDPFQNCSMIGKLNVPLVVIHGTMDEIVPYSQGRKIFELAPVAEKRFVAVAGGGHNDAAEVLGIEEYRRIILSAKQ